ncbi:lipoprotein [Nitratireductor sp. CH_MIT9313-5]|jgi:predicted small lipoprotein YifL|uniref:lipoprotein n=1 Tax=Nitratireductor sp. CH_MIT9313-5 TaxID=3107764 RepID=UPI0030089E39
MLARASALLLAFFVASAFSACGRKAPLDTPYEAAVEARKEAERNDEPVPAEPVKPVEDRPFILDSLI